MQRDKAKQEAINVMCQGVFKGIMKAMFVFGLVLFCGVYLLNKLNSDSTDYKGKHSGLIIKTDALTGCQYLENEQGLMIQRFSETGKQICTKGSEL